MFKSGSFVANFQLAAVINCGKKQKTNGGTKISHDPRVMSTGLVE